MRPPPTCPRCGEQLTAPGLWSSQWECATHGYVQPTNVHTPVQAAVLDQVAERSKVPVWLPYPLPAGWALSGVAVVGDARSGGVASAVALTGPGPLGGPADLLLVGEEPGIGLGARFAGLGSPDPGEALHHGAPEAKLDVAGHPTALWSLPTPADRAAYVGEAMGSWLWAILWPDSAGLLLMEQFALVDVRHRPVDPDLPSGPRCRRLACPGAER